MGSSMRRSLLVRAAILMLVPLMPLTGIRAAAASCCVDDCDQPCCARDASNSAVVPVLPCCRTVTGDEMSTHPAPTTLEDEEARIAAPSFVLTPLVAVVACGAVSARLARLLPGPPLYHQHCAL